MPPRSARLLVPAALVVAALGGSWATTAHGADPRTDRPVDTVTVRPGTLPRGEGPAVPRVIGTTIVDGEIRVRVAAQEVQLLGTSGDDYVAVVWLRRGPGRVDRIAADGARETLLDRVRGDMTLSRDGRQLFVMAAGDQPRSVVTVHDASTGERLARRAFRGYVWVLDADEDRAVLASSAPGRTFWWHTRTDQTRRISAQEGYFADVRADRVAVFTGNPLDGGCSVLAALSAPAATLWRSCDQAVVASSPGGHRALTQYIYMDGPVSKQEMHGVRGELLASYRAAGSFGPSTFESNRAVLLTTYGTTKAAVVRCRLDDCERASALVDTP